ncbi:MAG: ORF6N domain-containing protein [Deltaproteobacteria bacterium]|nr:ORF6N domain-containing protein [Deltaproteobacteria bacterium]
MQLVRIEGQIYELRGRRVLLDHDLAKLYGVETKVLNQAVRRNQDRFPDDFMFRLDAEESDSLRSQIVTLKSGRGQHRKFLPFAFTEQGVAMLSSVLRSPRAIQVNIEIMRAFVRLRQVQSQNTELTTRLTELEHKVVNHDESIRAIFNAIRQLIDKPVQEKKQIGFASDKTGFVFAAVSFAAVS